MLHAPDLVSPFTTFCTEHGIASGSDFSGPHTVIPIQRQHAHKIAISDYIHLYSALETKEDASRFRKRRGRGDTIIQTPR